MELFEDSNLNVLRRRKLNKLWDVNEQLYEVDVCKEKNNVLETDFDDILNTVGTHCHICNLEVPKMYIKEHNQTSTHQNLLKLTDEALERTRNHIKHAETSNVTIKVENTYFCDICSRIVENSEKELHEKSNYHKKCVNFNNLLSCFVDSYLNINEMRYDLNCDLGNDCNLKNDTAEYIILLSQMQQKELFKNLEPQEIQELLITENPELENTGLTAELELNQKQIQGLNQKQESNQELSKSPRKSKSEKLKSYFDTIKSKNSNKNFEIEYIPKNRVKITALNKDIIIVPVQHFHSYTNKFCRVCLSEVLEENHKSLEDHISRIMTPVADKNGIREVDDIWSHCIVCNELTKTVVSHNQSSNHLSNLKKFYLIQFSRSQMMQTENGQIETENGQKQSGNALEQFDESKNSDLKIDIAPHFEEFFKRIDSKIDSLFPIFKKALENESLSDGSDGFQLVGRKNKPYTSENATSNPNLVTALETKKFEIQTNKNSQNKSEIYQNSVQNKIESTTLEPQLSQCFVCRINVADFDSHKLSESHKLISKENKKRSQELRKILVRNYFLINKNQNSLTKCGLCDVIVNYDKGLIEAHINTDVHRKNYLKFMEKNKIILIDDQECHCEPCDERQSRNNIFNHCCTIKHANKLKNHLNKDTVENAAEKRKKSVEINVSKSNDVSKLMYNFITSAENLLCKTCNVCVPKKVVAIKKHIDSPEHCKKYNEIMTYHKVKINTDSFYCKICSVNITVGGEFDHVYSHSHKDRVLKSKTKIIDQKNVEPIQSTSKTDIIHVSFGGTWNSVPKVQPKKTEQEKIKEIMVPMYVKHHFKKTNKTDGHCKICNLSVPYTNITTHSVQFIHSFNFDVLMRKNGMKVKEGNIYTCLFCETTITRFNEVDHVFGRQHVKNLEGKKLSELTSDLENLTFKYISTLPNGNRQVLL